MKRIFPLLIITLFISCSQLPTDSGISLQWEDYDLEIESFEWSPDPYKFSGVIKDSVASSRGPQSAAWDYSAIGDIENMHAMWDQAARGREPLAQVKVDSFHQYKEVDAIAYILRRAAEHQVVIINEGHHMPQHRVFTTRLLAGLKDLGYNHLGLETYFASPITDSLLQMNGYPTLKTGFYTKEPQFGNLVREACALGFDVFGYESQGHDGSKEREINQAKNIQEYMIDHPNEKILIHCGFDHGLEGTLASQREKAMAGRLTEYTDVDPLTINQVTYSERSRRELENPYYQLTDVEGATVFVGKKDEVFGEYRPGSWFDISVFHPRSRDFAAPAWMIYDDRRLVDLSLVGADIECPCLVLAYKDGEEIGVAVPYYVRETEEENATLVLDRADYNIILLNQEGRSLMAEMKGDN